jgi:hypothetical protein
MPAIAAEAVIGDTWPVAAALCAPGIDGAQKAELRVAVIANRAVRCIFFPAYGAEKVLLHEYPLND